jgi:transcriptional regulator with XRE-family HTH domain
MNGLLIRRRLLELEQSREWLASKLGVSGGTVQSMLRGQRVRQQTTLKAAKVLGVDLSDLAPELAASLRDEPKRATASRR